MCLEDVSLTLKQMILDKDIFHLLVSEEYDIEREYYAPNFNMVKCGKYKLLWKQKLENDTHADESRNVI